MANRAFLTFSAADAKRALRLGLLSDTPEYGVEFYEESLRVEMNHPYAAHIQGVLRRKVEATGATVCLIGETTFASTWVNWDLQFSSSLGHKLIAMYLQGTTDAQLPPLLKEANTYCWKWDPHQLSVLIRSA
jgi:hypothetical protein